MFEMSYAFTSLIYYICINTHDSIDKKFPPIFEFKNGLTFVSLSTPSAALKQACDKSD